MTKNTLPKGKNNQSSWTVFPILCNLLDWDGEETNSTPHRFYKIITGLDTNHSSQNLPFDGMTYYDYLFKFSNKLMDLSLVDYTMLLVHSYDLPIGTLLRMQWSDYMDKNDIPDTNWLKRIEPDIHKDYTGFIRRFTQRYKQLFFKDFS